MVRKLLIVPLLLAAVAVRAQLTAEERKGISDALYLGNMTPTDLEFERKPFSDPYRFSLVDLCLDKPLDAADKLLQLHDLGGKRNVAQIIGLLRSDVFKEARRPEPAAVPAGDLPAEIPEDLKKPVGDLLASLEKANAYVRDALQKLSPDERRLLIESLPQWANEEPSIKFDFVKQPQASQATILRLLGQVDLSAIRQGAQELAAEVQEQLPALRKAAEAASLKTMVKTTIRGVVVELCGNEDDVHDSTDAALTIDLGGHNRYTGRYGAGIGYGSLLIDLGDDSVFDVPDASIGVGLLGIGLAYVMGGNDTFRGKSLCFGAGLAGVGVLLKDGGNDSYDSLSLTQGYGQFGVGLLLDTKGNDHYTAAFNAQGAARTEGVGWLLDKAGNDTYRAGGLVLNSPLFKDVYYSNAQGYASGYREDTGGISGGAGLLTDLQGDDDYLGETYCQAASYWFSLGSLYDAGGHDTYTAYHYAQASAMHMTAAYLFDLAGDDAYVCKMGACHAIGHDYGVGFFLDRAGSDVYAARDSRPAIGNANGLGMFVDSAGDDRYFGPPGVGNPARGSGSLGVFVDINGANVYAEGLADGGGEVRDGWGVAYSAQTAVLHSDQAPPPDTSVKPNPNSQPMPSDAEMEQIYRKATQWGVGTAQKEVADNVNRLISIGDSALKWMINHKLAQADRLQQRAFVAVVNALGASGHQLIAPLVASKNEDESRMALSIAVESNVKEAAPFIPTALKNPKLQRAAARAAGTLGSKESVPELMKLSASPDRLTALNALISLAGLTDEQSYGTGEALLGSTDLPIRKAALALVAKFPAKALDTARQLTGSSDERMVRTGIELLGIVGSPEALHSAGELLADPRPGVKIQAMLALNGRVPAEYRAAVVDMRKNANPLVQAVAARIDLGR